MISSLSSGCPFRPALRLAVECIDVGLGDHPRIAESLRYKPSGFDKGKKPPTANAEPVGGLLGGEHLCAALDDFTALAAADNQHPIVGVPGVLSCCRMCALNLFSLLAHVQFLLPCVYSTILGIVLSRGQIPE